MDIIVLNDDWTVEYFEPNVDGFEMAPSVQPVPRLPLWTCAGRFAEAGFYAWLQRQFDLHETEECVHYVVQIERAPATTRVYMNDQHLADCDAPVIRVDVTDYVTLGKNRLSLRVDCAADGEAQFEAVTLLQLPCDPA